MLAILSALLAAAPLAAAPPSGASPAPPGAAVCQIVGIGSPEAPRLRNSFPATRIVALEFEARLHRRGMHEQALRLQVFTPGGFLYQVLTVPLGPPGAESQTQPSQRSPGGARNDRHPSRLTARLPVAGTSIMASGLYGRWKVVPHLDDRKEPCGSGRSFVIEP